MNALVGASIYGRPGRKHRARVLMGIRERKLMPDTYVITLPQSGNHILDIRPVMLLTEGRTQREGFPDFRRGRGIWGKHVR